MYHMMESMNLTLLKIGLFRVGFESIYVKDAFHAHNSKTHFSPSNDSCIH